MMLFYFFLRASWYDSGMDHETLASLGAHFSSFIEHYGYLGIFFWFVVVDQVTPIPDEISLITIGYLCAEHLFHFPPLAALAAIAAFLLVDVIEFTLSRRGSARSKKLTAKLSSGWLGRYKEKIAVNFPKTLLILTFIPRMRVFAPFLAGAVGVRRERFVAFDALGLVLFTSVYISLGYFFHAGILHLFDELGHYRHEIFMSILFILLIVMLVIAHRSKKKAECLS